MGSSDIFALLGPFRLAVVLVAAIWFWRAPLRIDSRRAVVGLTVLWTIAATYEFWIFGERSFASLGAEVEYAIPGLLYMNAAPDGVQFLRGLGGGVDAQSFATFAGQSISLERLLLRLPLGAANMIHKGLLVAISTIGMYRLARSYNGIGRAPAFAAAALFSLSHERLLLMTWSHGFGFALVPLACYLVARRSREAGYFLPVAALAGLNAVSCTPTHSFLALLTAVVAVAIIDDKKAWPHFGRIACAVLILIAAVLANWHEGLYAKSLIGPMTSRGTTDPDSRQPMDFLFLAVGVVGALMIWLDGRRIFALRFLGAGTLVLLVGVVAQALATAIPGLSPIKAINFQNTGIAVFTLAPLAFVCARLPDRTGGWPRGLSAVFAALPLGKLAWLKLYVPLVWLSQGGLSVVSGGMTQLAATPWLPAEPVRVVSVPYRLPSNLAAAAGLDTFDGFYPLILRSVETFWNGILAPRHANAESGSIGLEDTGIDFKCCATYELANHANLDLLRIANVGFILSTVPLSDSRLIQIHGPFAGAPPLRADPLVVRTKKYAELIVKSAPIRVYALPPPLPRLYAARKIHVLPVQSSENAVLAKVARVALDRDVAVGANQIPAGVSIKGDVTIDSWSLLADGASASVTVQGSGMLVFNVPYSRFWHAYVDDREEKAFPVNIVQMATMVPRGSHRVEFRYVRPLLREKIAQAINR